MNPYVRILPVALIVVFIIFTVTSRLEEEEVLLESYSESWTFDGFAAQFECMAPNWCDTYYNDSAEAQALLHKLQFPEDCSTAKFLVLPYEYWSGMGSSMHIRAEFMSIAVHENRIYILPDGSTWEFGKVCDPPTYECYFEPITNCSVSLHAPDWEKAPILTKFGQHIDVRVVRLPNGFILNPPEGFSRERFVPYQFAHKDYLWWHSQITAFNARPNKRSKAIVAEVQREMFPNGEMPHPIISMYVRHGDKWKEAKLRPFSDYMAIAKNLTETYGVTNIYLGTDDPGVIAESRNYTEYTFYYINSTRYNGGPLEIVHINKGADLMRVSIGDLYTQIEGDIFIGTRTSNWCRLIDELRKMGGKARIPYYTPETYEEMLSQEK